MVSRISGVQYGCDPELFLERGGKIIGSEKVLPQEGLARGDYYNSEVVIDGVQIELNPNFAGSVSDLGRGISGAFYRLRTHLGNHAGVRCCFKGVVEVDREELDSLSPKSRLLGCQPSMNVYGSRPITVDATTYRKRSAGGHFHFGLSNLKNIFYRSARIDERKRLVPLFDIICANTCVMFDRDPLAAERRENYGRAGEFRLPKHGLEYRTLSNFWLRNYSLMSLVLGLADFAISVLNTSLSGTDIEQELVDNIDIMNVIKAIDLNDFDLARENFEVVRKFMMKHLPSGNEFQIGQDNLHKFLKFVDVVRAKGLEAFFHEDPVEHWASNNRVEFSAFLGGF